MDADRQEDDPGYNQVACPTANCMEHFKGVQKGSHPDGPKPAHVQSLSNSLNMEWEDPATAGMESVRRAAGKLP
jgi:hypothetical protein